MIWVEFMLMLIGGCAAMAAFSAAIAVLVIKFMGDDEDDKANW